MGKPEGNFLFTIVGLIIQIVSTAKLIVFELGERNWREDEWRGEFDQSDSILFVCQRRENFSSSNSIIVYISHEFYIEFPAAHRYPWCNTQSRFALSRSPRTSDWKQ